MVTAESAIALTAPRLHAGLSITGPRFLGSCLVLFFLFSLAGAQQQDKPVSDQRIVPIVTAAASVDGVRFTATNTYVQIRLQIFSEAGTKLFDSTYRAGNVLDWKLQDQAGQPVAAGSYLCVVTVKSLSGKESQKLGTVSLAEKSVSLQPAETTQLTAAQTLALGAMENSSALTVLRNNEAESATVLAHNGTDGQMIRSRGALSFRLGDFFSGDDQEQMRLTEEGNLGIGTSEPKAKLDVAGTIRAERVLIAKPKTAGSNTAQATDAQGSAQPLASGSGTQDRIAKWIDNAGTLGDGAVYETGGLVVIGQNSSGQLAPLAAVSGQYHTVEVGVPPGGKSPLTLAGGSGVMEFWKDLGGGVGNPAAAVSFGMAVPGTSATNDMLFSSYMSSGGGWNERMRLTNAGNLGIGTNNPQSLLDVAGNINTSTQYNINGNRVFAVTGAALPTTNTFAGVGAGALTTPSATTGDGHFNSFFGYSAGPSNTTGQNNSFFGIKAGQSNTTGGANSFFGANAGFSNTTSNGNSFFGIGAGVGNTTGATNSFFGRNAGQSNTTENNNTFLGAFSNGAAGITNATAVGFQAQVTQSNSLVLGSINTDTNVGIGTTAPLGRLDVRGDIFVGLNSVPDAPLGANSLFIRNDGQVASGNSLRIDGAINNLYLIGRSAPGSTQGTGIIFRTATAGAGEIDRVYIDPDGNVAINVLGSAGATQLCRNASNQISTCSSSLRYKKDVVHFSGGLNVVNRLHPITFRWKTDQTPDLGLGAEDVAAVEPLLVTHNSRGQVEGVKYDRLSAVFINAFKEQQAQIARQQAEAKKQQDQIAAVRVANAALNARLRAIEKILKKHASTRARH